MIRSVGIINGAIPLTETVPAQQWVSEWSSQLFVKVVCDDAMGWGEILPAGGSSREPYSSLVKRLGDTIVGTNETDVGGIWDSLRKLTFSGGYGITTGAISGIDIALWDVAAKRKKKSLAELLGGNNRKVKRYASMSRYRTVQEAVSAVGWLLEKGFKSIKLHQSGKDTAAAVRLVRKEFGSSVDLRVDLNCAFDFKSAMTFMKEVARYELTWVEEPVWPPDDFESLKKLNAIGPVAAGENFFSYFEFKRLMEMDALTYYQPDVAKIGGVTPAIEFLKLAKKHHAKVAFHNRPDNGWVSTLASAHLAASLDPKATIESPPNGVPEEYFEFSGSLDNISMEPGGIGLGIAPLDTIPTSTDSKMLRFHER